MPYTASTGMTLSLSPHLPRNTEKNHYHPVRRGVILLRFELGTQMLYSFSQIARLIHNHTPMFAVEGGGGGGGCGDGGGCGGSRGAAVMMMMIMTTAEDLGSSLTHYDLNCLITSSTVVVLLLQSICVSSFISGTQSL
jgi:hypothetical protein